MARDAHADRPALVAVEERPPTEEPARLRAPSGRTNTGALTVAVFTSGAVLLGLEIAASRVLAPFFGNSLFVWGALIGVVLTGLAIGYWIGGTLAYRAPRPALLAATMMLGGLLVLAIPVVDGPVLREIVARDAGPRLNPLLAAVALFGLPSVVFAAVTPIAVRLVASSVATLGRSAGRLFAVSTAGSIVGTFVTAFVLIPEFGTNQLLGQAAAAMFVAVALFALVERLPLVLLAAVLGAASAGAASVALAPESGGRLTGAEAENFSPLYRLRADDVAGRTDYRGEGLDVLFREETRYHNLAVVEDDASRYLRFDSSFQSGMFIERPFATRFAYTDFFSLGLAYNPRARDVLFIGLGGGSAPKRMWRDFPNLRLQVAELDPVVVDVAYRYFGLPRSPRLRVAVEDGRRYLAETDARWDVIAIDAYYSDSVPFHLTTREFVELARSRLKPGGVIVSNVIGSLNGPGSRLLRAFARTYRTVFPTVLVHPVSTVGERDDEVRNLALIATAAAAPDTAFLEQRWNRLRREHPSAPDLRRAIRGRHDSPLELGDVPTLTDDYAPTDALLFFDQ